MAKLRIETHFAPRSSRAPSMSIPESVTDIERQMNCGEEAMQDRQHNNDVRVLLSGDQLGMTLVQHRHHPTHSFRDTGVINCF
jgi:hypothetical protein